MWRPTRLVTGWVTLPRRVGSEGSSTATTCFEGGEVLRGVEAELVSEPGPVLARGAQRFALPAAAMQPDHQRPPGPLPARMVRRDRPGLAHRRLAATQPQEGLGVGLAGKHAQLLQPRRLPLRPPLPSELRERVAPPEAQRLLQPRQRRLGAVRETRQRLAQGRLETLHVDRARLQAQPVARRGGLQTDRRRQQPPQSRHVGLQRRRRRLGRFVAPQHLDQPVDAEHRAPIRQQHGQQPPRQGPTNRHRPTVHLDGDRAENPHRRLRRGRCHGGHPRNTTASLQTPPAHTVERLQAVCKRPSRTAAQHAKSAVQPGQRNRQHRPALAPQRRQTDVQVNAQLIRDDLSTPASTDLGFNIN